MGCQVSEVQILSPRPFFLLIFPFNKFPVLIFSIPHHIYGYSQHSPKLEPALQLVDEEKAVNRLKQGEEP